MLAAAVPARTVARRMCFIFPLLFQQRFWFLLAPQAVCLTAPRTNDCLLVLPLSPDVGLRWRRRGSTAPGQRIDDRERNVHALAGLVRGGHDGHVRGAARRIRTDRPRVGPRPVLP